MPNDGNFDASVLWAHAFLNDLHDLQISGDRDNRYFFGDVHEVLP